MYAKLIELELRTNFGIGGEYKELEYDNVNGSGELLFDRRRLDREIGLGYLFIKVLLHMVHRIPTKFSIAISFFGKW